MTKTPKPAAPVQLDAVALALITVSDAPLLLLDDALNLVALSHSFRDDFHIDPAVAIGRPVFAMGGGEWDVPQLRSLLTATLNGAAIKAYEMDLPADGGVRRLVLKASRLDDAAGMLVVLVCDVTQARQAERLKDNLLREKGVLLQEVQHRVANSLQIIASVLLQNARKVSSEETRMHLKDAHNRVMSVAALQQQLASSSLSEVAVGPYLDQLCASIAASMIHDPDQLAITVQADASRAPADISTSLGLIVTELVINALKHAFPGHRRGAIIVAFHGGANWTLSVSDNGVGMPPPAANGKSGLGTSIIQALAQQLEARVEVSSANPGTRVAIAHSPVAPAYPDA